MASKGSAAVDNLINGLDHALIARKQAIPVGAIKDPEGILKWLGPDRAVGDLPTADAFTDKREPLAAVIRQWLEFIP